MHNRTAWILMAVALVLIGYIFLIEKGSQTTDEKNARKNHVFENYRKDSVDRLELQIAGSTKVVLTRVSTVESGQERWEITAPVRSRADSSAISEILSSIDFLTVERRVEEDLGNSRFALAKPRIKGSFTINKETTGFSIGGDDPSAENVYVSNADNSEVIFVVNREFFDSLNKTLDQLRDRHLFPAPLSDAVAITSGTVILKKVDRTEIWEVNEGGQPVAASRSQVLELLDTMGNMSAVKFEADPSRRPSSFSHFFTATHPDGRTDKVQLGGDCGEKLVYASVDGSDVLACVSTDIINLLSRPGHLYIEKRPLAADLTDVSRLTVERDGKKVVVEKSPEDLWQIAGRTVAQTDQIAVSSFIEDYNKVVADAVISASALPADSLKNAAQLRFELDSGQPAVVLTVHAPVVNPDGTAAIHLRRNAEPFLLQMKPALLDRIWADELAFATRTIENGNPLELFRITRSGLIEETLQRSNENVWQIEAPASIRADQDAAVRIATLISNTPAVRFFDSAAADKVAGFKTPFLVVRGAFHRKPEKPGAAESDFEETLEIGAPATEGGRYARIRGQLNRVFVLSEADVQLLTSPAAARDLLAINTTDVIRVELRNGSRVISADRKDNQWTVAAGQTDNERLNRALVDLSAIKAQSAHSWGKSIDKPALIVETYAAEGSPGERLSFETAPAVEGVDGGKECRAVKAGLDIIWIIPCRVMDELLSLFTAGAR